MKQCPWETPVSNWKVTNLISQQGKFAEGILIFKAKIGL
jgi:hypothetical protein